MIDILYPNLYRRSKTYKMIRINNWNTLPISDLSKNILEHSLSFVDLLNLDKYTYGVDNIFKLAKTSLSNEFLKPKLYEEIIKLTREIKNEKEYRSVFNKKLLDEKIAIVLLDLFKQSSFQYLDLFSAKTPVRLIANKLYHFNWWTFFDYHEVRKTFDLLKENHLIIPHENLDERYNVLIGLFQYIFSPTIDKHGDFIDDGQEEIYEEEQKLFIDRNKTIKTFKLNRSKTDLAEIILLFAKSEIFSIENRPAQIKEIQFLFEYMIDDSINVYDLIRNRYSKEAKLDNSLWLQSYVPDLIEVMLEARKKEIDKRQ